MLKKMLLTAALIALVFTLVGCQTVQGLGKDLEWMGQKMGETVD
jgi:predicted small secreted protein